MSSGPVDLFLPLDEDELELPRLAASAAGLSGPVRVRVIRRSLDARRGHPVGWRLRVVVTREGEREEVDAVGLPAPMRPHGKPRVVVVGSGPAGSFAALRLAEAGVLATVVERGKPVQPRRRDLANLTARGTLNDDSNYCFGEGGAGTFSDGKLYTRSKDKRAIAEVLKVLIAHGADPNIAIDSRPHIGSNKLPKILLELRAAMTALGVGYRFDDPVVDLLLKGDQVAGVRLRSGEELEADHVVLATGHSARPIYELCAARGVAIEAKPFAIGARIEHPQPMIDSLQYGRAAGHDKLPAAFYQLTSQVPTTRGERGVYSFCMCPGGWVVPAATEQDGMCVNGMSLKRRDSPFANSALVVSVDPRDFGAEGPLAGIAFQRAIEQRALIAGGGGFIAPAQRVGDFMRGHATETPLGSSYRPGVVGGRIDTLLPPFVTEALRAGLRRFDKMMTGFAGEQAQLVGVETRTSAPVRIIRDPQSLQSPTTRGLYPSAEGAGYAGGIVSAAIDGLRIADAILAAS